jgi:hypothetical protein
MTQRSQNVDFLSEVLNVLFGLAVLWDELQGDDLRAVLATSLLEEQNAMGTTCQGVSIHMSHVNIRHRCRRCVSFFSFFASISRLVCAWLDLTVRYYCVTYLEDLSEASLSNLF